MANITLILTSGGAVVLKNAFIAGNGVAGDVAGETKWFADSDIEKVIN